MKLRWRDRLLLLTLKAFAQLPYRCIYGLGWCIGSLLYYFNSKIRGNVVTNITRCFPELSNHERQQLIKAAMRHTFIRGLEMPYFWFAPINRILKLIKASEGEHAAFERAATKGAGAFFMFLHHGCWEIINCHFGTQYDITVLYKPPKDATQDALLNHVRQRLGRTTMYPTSVAGIRNIIKTLKAGGKASFSPDHQPPNDQGIFVPFFGIPALTMTLPYKLVKKVGVEACLTYAIRLPKGHGFKLMVVPVTDPAFYGQDEVAATAALNREIEAVARQHPEQYEWSYRRFRKRPPEEQGDNQFLYP